MRLAFEERAKWPPVSRTALTRQPPRFRSPYR